jgi:hypothetical protein
LVHFAVFYTTMQGTIRIMLIALTIIAVCDIQAIAQERSQTYTVVLLPEFLTAREPKNDTTFSYEYYDARSRKVSLDTVVDISTIHSVSVIKSYTDRAHTFVDKDGKEKPLPVSKIVYRYDRSGPGKWMSIDYATNKIGSLKELPNEIVHTDSATVTMNNTTQVRVNKYYRVTRAK